MSVLISVAFAQVVFFFFHRFSRSSFCPERLYKLPHSQWDQAFLQQFFECSQRRFHPHQLPFYDDAGYHRLRPRQPNPFIIGGYICFDQSLQRHGNQRVSPIQYSPKSHRFRRCMLHWAERWPRPRCSPHLWRPLHISSSPNGGLLQGRLWQLVCERAPHEHPWIWWGLGPGNIWNSGPPLHEERQRCLHTQRSVVCLCAQRDSNTRHQSCIRLFHTQSQRSSAVCSLPPPSPHGLHQFRVEPSLRISTQR